MSHTIIALNKEYFTAEITKCFLKDLENTCQSMEVEGFTNLFNKYDLTFIEDYQEVLDLIKHVMSNWEKPEQETELLEMRTFDSKCLFCKIGKTVKVYKWTYQHKQALPPMNRVVYTSKVGFRFELKEGRLIEYGICNAFV